MEIKASWWRRYGYKLKFNALDKEVMRAVVQESLYVEKPEYDYIRTYYLSQKSAGLLSAAMSGWFI